MGVDRAIQRCLEPDPALRPAFAVAVAASLPETSRRGDAVSGARRCSGRDGRASAHGRGRVPRDGRGGLKLHPSIVGRCGFAFWTPVPRAMRLVPCDFSRRGPQADAQARVRLRDAAPPILSKIRITTRSRPHGARACPSPLQLRASIGSVGRRSGQLSAGAADSDCRRRSASVAAITTSTAPRANKASGSTSQITQSSKPAKTGPA